MTIMKKIFRFMMAALAATAAMTACQQENLEPDVQEQEGVTYIVNASLSEATKASLSDADFLKWEDEDKVVAWYIDSDDDYAYAKREEAAVVLGEDKTNASLTFNTLPAGGKFWLAYQSNTGYDGCSARKVEFNYTNAQTQQVAGIFNTDYLRLIGSETDVPVLGEGESSVVLDVEMKIVGTLMRYLVYSSTGAYKEETVKSVELVSVDNVIAGSASAVAYNFAEYHNTDAGYKYWANSEGSQFSDNCTIFWDATSKSITTTLAQPLSLEGVIEPKQGTGIYMTVPAVNVGGYKYVVTTDVAKYTFDASSKPLAFADNMVKNVILNLENTNVSRIELASIKGELQYTGDLNAASQKLSYEGVTDKDGGYWYAQTRDTGADWVNREGASNTQFYTGVQFECIDNATGENADWLTVAYRTDGNTHWFITAEPQEEGAPERSATVTATFPDVDGYIVTEACKTKVLTVTQQAYTTMKILSLGGGVGDQVISGAGVDKLSLGWCVIAVNGSYAESWGDDKNNEQALYGNVLIECREGAANGPIVDWLTVEYGKDANGKFNSTHLLATAPENNTGAERKALVCCTYTAPDGYEFEGGAKSVFKQFFVTQPVNSGVKTVEFWGGIGADYTHNYEGQLDWGLSYWVIKVDGADATDWNGDTHNEQLLYGAAEFKCYDYTNGVRGAEVDWVTVEYKKDGEGKIIDTWWLADIQENTTGAVRKAEIVCTFSDLEGYVYKNGQNVKSTIIVQNPSEPAGGDAEGGDDDVVVEGMSYTIFNNAADGSKGTGFGPGAGSVGDWYRFENITINGKTYTPGDEIKNLANNTELMAELMAKAFEFGEITASDVQIPGTDPLTTDPESFVTLVPWSEGGAAIYVRIVLTANDSGARRTFKIITKDDEGNQVSSVVYFQNS